MDAIILEPKFAKGLEYAQFVGLLNYGPAGTQFDIAQAHVGYVRKDHNDGGWDQPR